MKYILRVFILSIGFLSMPATAQPNARTVEVSPISRWTHQHTGLTIPPGLGKTIRTSVQDSSQNQYDIWIDFHDPDHDLYSNIYIYRAGIPDVSIWFDRAQKMIEARDAYQLNGQIDAPLSTIFAAPNSEVPNALRAAYALPETSAWRSTALAILPLNGWIVKFRFSSRSLSREELDESLVQAINELIWPKPPAPSAPARWMTDCADPVAYRPAHLLPTGLDHVIADSVLGKYGSQFAADRSHFKQGSDQITYCRETSQHKNWGHYRPESDPDSYLLAIQDAGRSVQVYPATLKIDGTKRYAVTWLDVENANHHSHFDKLPAPQQAFDLTQQERPLATTAPEQKTLVILPPKNSGRK